MLEKSTILESFIGLEARKRNVMKTSTERNTYSEYADKLTKMGYTVKIKSNNDGTNYVKISFDKTNSMGEPVYLSVIIHERHITDFCADNFYDTQAMDIIYKILCINPEDRVYISEKDYMLVSTNRANGQLACLELNPNMILGFNYAYFYHIKDIPKDKIDKFLYTKEEAQRWVTPAIKMVSYTESVKKPVMLSM